MIKKKSVSPQEADFFSRWKAQTDIPSFEDEGISIKGELFPDPFLHVSFKFFLVVTEE